MGSNHEKNGGRKSRDTLPLNIRILNYITLDGDNEICGSRSVNTTCAFTLEKRTTKRKCTENRTWDTADGVASLGPCKVLTLAAQAFRLHNDSPRPVIKPCNRNNLNKKGENVSM